MFHFRRKNAQIHCFYAPENAKKWDYFLIVFQYLNLKNIENKKWGIADFENNSSSQTVGEDKLLFLEGIQTYKENFIIITKTEKCNKID